MIVMVTDIYLFDWGDTLMVDFPGVPGKMRDWETVEAVDGAESTLQFLSKKSEIYIATGAAQSTEADIKAAFQRVGLDCFITGYFCKSNIGIEKGSTLFLSIILDKLGKQPTQVTMVGDSMKKDIEPALRLGIRAVFMAKDKRVASQGAFRTITSLKELCIECNIGVHNQ